jgi:hypothetical protein
MFGIIKGIILTVVVLFVLHYFVGIDINKTITQTGEYTVSVWHSIQNIVKKD